MSYKDNEFKAYITGDTPNYEYHHTKQSVYIVDKIPDVGTEWSFEPQGNYICGKVKSIAPVEADSNTIRSSRANPMSFYYDCFEVCLDNLNDCPDCLEDTSYIVAVELDALNQGGKFYE